MIRKGIFYLILAIIFSCKPTSGDVQNKVADTSINIPVVEELSIDNNVAEPKETISDSALDKQLDLSHAINEIYRCINDIEGFEEYKSHGGMVVNNDGYSISIGVIDNVYLITLDILSYRNSDGEAYHQILDIDSVKNNTNNPVVQHTYFQYKGNINDETLHGFVTIKNDTCDQILKVWKIDFENNKLMEVDKDETELTYNWFGYDG